MERGNDSSRIILLETAWGQEQVAQGLGWEYTGPMHHTLLPVMEKHKAATESQKPCSNVVP